MQIISPRIKIKNRFINMYGGKNNNYAKVLVRRHSHNDMAEKMI